MKRILAILLMLAIASVSLTSLAEPTAANSKSDYSFLEGMSLNELLDLQREVETRITIEKGALALKQPTDYGMWIIETFVDVFGNPTEDKYITNKYWIVGSFCNSAVEDAKLRVRFIIDTDDVAIQLYEYAGSNPVKVYDKTVYDVSILDSNGKKYTCEATEYSDRLYLPRDILDILAQNGTIRFYIEETGAYANSSYLFTIEDTSYIQNALAFLSE